TERELSYPVPPDPDLFYWWSFYTNGANASSQAAPNSHIGPRLIRTSRDSCLRLSRQCDRDARAGGRCSKVFTLLINPFERARDCSCLVLTLPCDYGRRYIASSGELLIVCWNWRTMVVLGATRLK